MAIPDHLTLDQKTNIVSLPYRVGLWVSLGDATGGTQADKQELVALANIIDGFSCNVFGSELVQHIMAETLSRRAEWKSWAKDIANIPGDCRAAVYTLGQHVEAREVAVYAARLMEIAEAVALAFREQEEPKTLARKAEIYAAYGLHNLRASIKKVPRLSFDEFLNISPAERKLLRRLASALGVVYV